VQTLFRQEHGELIVQMPEGGVDPSWLARPGTQLGLPPANAISALRVESTPEWRWGTADAAFIATLVQQLDSAERRVPIRGLPRDLENLIALARTKPQSPTGAGDGRAGLLARLGLASARYGRGFREFIDLLGEVVLLAPRFIAGRARVRGSEMLEVLAESSSRALLIVGVVNLLMGAILAFVGAVQLRMFGAGIYVADLVWFDGISFSRPALSVSANFFGSTPRRSSTPRGRSRRAV
jgi:phospholipid/cholesterol/gamma-HCH transport system permease protein